MKLNLRLIRYVIVILSSIISVYAIQIFIQNFNIEKEIKTLKKNKKILENDTYWIKYYYEPFLKTDYAKLYFQHRAWIVWKNEILIKIISKKNENYEKKISFEKYKAYRKINCIQFFKTLKKKYFN